MRFPLVVIVLSALGACDRAPSPRAVSTQPVNERASDDGPVQPADVLRSDDLKVLDAALSDFASDPKFEPIPSFAKGRRVVIHRETLGGSAYVRADQVQADSREGQLPGDAVADLEARNNGGLVTVSGMTFSSTQRAGAALVGWTPSTSDVIVTDLTRFRSTNPRWDKPFEFEEALLKVHADAKAYAWVSLPGYTADGSKAIVRVSFGPTAHGAMATYLLQKGPEGKWTVTWRKRAYYA